MPKSGKNLERLIELIERGLSDCENVEIEAPGKLRDSVTGRLREHDVLITIKHAHHTVRISIECRDRSRPVGVPAIEAFSKKCEHTGINQACFASSNGFTGTARTKADFLNIRCLDLQEASEFSWLGARGVKHSTRAIHKIDCRILLSGSDDDLPEDYSLVVDDRPFSNEELYASIYENLKSEFDNDHPPGEYRVQSGLNTQNLEVIDNSTGLKRKVEKAAVQVVYRVFREFVPFQLYSYRDEKANKTASEMATAEIQTPLGPGRLSVVFEPGKGGQLLFSRESLPDDTV